MPNYVQLNAGLNRGFSALNAGLNFAAHRENLAYKQKAQDELLRQQNYNEAGSRWQLLEQDAHAAQGSGDLYTEWQGNREAQLLDAKLMLGDEGLAKLAGEGAELIDIKDEDGKLFFKARLKDGSEVWSPQGLSGRRLFNETRLSLAYYGAGRMKHTIDALTREGRGAEAEALETQYQETLAGASEGGVDPAQLDEPETQQQQLLRMVQEQEQEDQERASKALATTISQRSREHNAVLNNMKKVFDPDAPPKKKGGTVEEEETKVEHEEAEGPQFKAGYEDLAAIDPSVYDSFAEQAAGDSSADLAAMPDSDAQGSAAHRAGQSLGRHEQQVAASGGTLNHLAEGQSDSGLIGGAVRAAASGLVNAGKAFMAGRRGEEPIRAAETKAAKAPPVEQLAAGEATLSPNITSAQTPSGDRVPILRHPVQVSTLMHRPLSQEGTKENQREWARRGTQFMYSMAALNGGKLSPAAMKVGTEIASTGNPHGLAKGRILATQQLANARIKAALAKTRASKNKDFDRYDDWVNTRAEGSFRPGKNRSFSPLRGLNLSNPSEYRAFWDEAVAGNVDVFHKMRIPTRVVDSDGDGVGQRELDYSQLTDSNYAQIAKVIEPEMRKHNRDFGGINLGVFKVFQDNHGDRFGQVDQKAAASVNDATGEWFKLSPAEQQAVLDSQGMTEDEFLMQLSAELLVADDD